MTGRPVRFRIATRATGIRRALDVLVYDDVAQLRADAESMSGTSHAESKGVVQFPGYQWPRPEHSWMGVIRLWRAQLTGEVIAHEAAHAAAELYFADCTAWESRTRIHFRADNETFAYAVGHLTAAITRGLYRLRYLPDPPPMRTHTPKATNTMATTITCSTCNTTLTADDVHDAIEWDNQHQKKHREQQQMDEAEQALAASGPQTYWNGLQTQCTRGTAEVADAPQFPKYWARHLVGSRIEVARVLLDGVAVGGGFTYVDDREGRGWAKLLAGGGPHIPSAHVEIVESSFVPAEVQS